MRKRGDDGDNLFYLAMGPMAAIFLGAALVPIRGFTTASNFAFVFMALTILVAELGGRWAAVATALASGLSLDFFLTQPYMRLTIAEKHDVIAVAGLTACGLIAAAFGSQRGKQSAALAAASRRLELLDLVLREAGTSPDVEASLARILRASRDALPLAAAIVRDVRNRVVASADAADEGRGVPAVVLPPGPPSIPDEGARIELVLGSRRLGWLDVWPGAAHFPDEAGRTLSDLARSVAILLAGERPRVPPRE